MPRSLARINIRSCLHLDEAATRPSVVITRSAAPAGRLRDPSINPPITQADLNTGYTFQTRQKHFKSQENLVVLAFSGGGTRAAAFSYGRISSSCGATEVIGPKGNNGPLARRRRHDHRRIRRELHRARLRPVRRQAVRRLRAAFPQARRARENSCPRAQSGQLGQTVVDGVGSFRTGGRFVRRDPVQRCDLRRPRSRRRPVHRGVGHRHLERRPDASSTRTSSMCCATDLNAVRLSRAAAASSAVPVVLSPSRINNYGGTCGDGHSVLGQGVHPIRRIRRVPLRERFAS